MSNFDEVAFAMAGLSLVADAIKARKTESQGAGFVECPRCQGQLRYSFQRRKRTSRPLSYAAQCETQGCIQFTGH